MPYSAILNENIQVGDPITQSLMQKIKDNFDFIYGVVGAGGDGTGGIQNPSFDVDSDSDGDPDNWTLADYAAGSHALDATNALHGAYALKFVHPGGAGNGGGYADSSFMECSELRPFVVNFLHKCSQSGVKVQVVVRYFTEALVDLSADETIYSTTTNPTTATSIATSAATPPATAQYCKIRFIGGATDTDPGSSTNIWFDGVSLDTGGYTASATGFMVGASGAEITSTKSEVYHKCAEGVAVTSGTLYSSFYIKNTGENPGETVSGTVRGRVYVNGVATGTSHLCTTGWGERTDASIAVSRGDLIQLYLTGDADATYPRYATVNGWTLRSSTGEDKTFAIQHIPKTFSP